jgi:dTDP-4-amino-4,6-dideoxygalactose transaminase
MIEYENLAKSNETFLKEYQQSFQDILKSGQFILGDNVSVFEKEFAAYNCAKYCIGVASGLDALILSLKALDIPKGSEVIVPSNTYIATILSVIHCGLKPVFVEPDIMRYNIDPKLIAEKITDKTKAILIVHLYGKPCDMSPIMEIKRKHDLILIEDCAQSHGARYMGKCTGTFGEFGAFSFYPTKNLGALGDAGGILTENMQLACVIRCLRNYGSEIKYYNELVGYNSRLDELQAGFLSVKLRSLDIINKHKRSLASLYTDNLKEDFMKPVVDKDVYDVYHIYNIRHPKRDKLKDYLLDKGIKTEIHYPVPPHKQKAMIGIVEQNYFPISEEIHKTTLSLPISYSHSADDIYKVIEVMNRF